MAISRSAVLFAKDAGRWLIVDADAETWVNVKAATRYTNLAAFEAAVPTTSWRSNRFGDGDKKLIDAAYGFEVRDRFFTDPVDVPPDINNNTPNVASALNKNPELGRLTIVYSYDNAGYLWQNPNDVLKPPADREYRWVDNAFEATRFINIQDWEDIMDNTELGRVQYGYALRQYVFTKPPFDPTTIRPFNVAGLKNTFSRTRAYIPYSQEVGRYLWIDPNTRSGPIANMRFNWVTNPWQGARFTNLIEFRNIVNGRPDFFSKFWSARNWETPQFYFTQGGKVRPKPKITIFFENPTGCGQSYFLPQPKKGWTSTYDYFTAMAQHPEFAPKYTQEQENDDWFAREQNQNTAKDFLSFLINDWGLYDGRNTVSNEKWYNEEQATKWTIERLTAEYGPEWKKELENQGLEFRSLISPTPGCYYNVFFGSGGGGHVLRDEEGAPLPEFEKNTKDFTFSQEGLSLWVTNDLWREANGLTPLLPDGSVVEGGNGGNFEGEPGWREDPLDIQLYYSGNINTCGYLTLVKQYQGKNPSIVNTYTLLAWFATQPEFAYDIYVDGRPEEKWRHYYEVMFNKFLNNYDAGWVSRDCYWKWYEQQDKTLIEQWLYDIWSKENNLV